MELIFKYPIDILVACLSFILSKFSNGFILIVWFLTMGRDISYSAEPVSAGNTETNAFFRHPFSYILGCNLRVDKQIC